MTAILGISAFYHDSAAALLIDGEIVAAAQEERFSRKKHDDQFPHQAVAYCLGEAGIGAADLDHVGFYDKPFLKFERLLESYLAVAPRGIRQFYTALPLWLGQKLHLPSQMKRALGGEYRKRFVFTEHHESHAASAFFPSPFEEAAILTLDGVGEWATTSFGTGRGNRIALTQELHFPHSIGLLYAAFTAYCGFRVNSGEYKVMGLAPYGEPRFVDTILEHLLDLKEDGSFRMDMSYFNYCHGLTMTSEKFHRLFGQPPREPESELTQFTKDIAASIQKVTEEIMLRCARHAHRITGQKNLCLAGGVALNCVGNGRILREGPFEDIWVQPASNDAGGALGAAFFIWHQLLEKSRVPLPSDSQKGSLLGPRFPKEECRQALEEAGAVYREIPSEHERAEWIAGRIADGKVIGLLQGRMEFGPRALGCRSILGDPRSPEMQSVINLKVKFRESFRPFAPSVLSDRAAEQFEFDRERESPYMLIVTQARNDGLPAITHVDGSARLQTVDGERHGFYHRMVGAFAKETGCPLVINTSFNVRGEPIVCTPADAWRCFMATDIDALVVEDFVLLKEEQTASAPPPPDFTAKKPPSEWELRWFGWLFLFFAGAFAALAWWGWKAPMVAAFAAGLGVVVAGAYQAAPRWRLSIYRGWMSLVYPIGWLVSHLVLTLIFFLVFTPIGFLMKLCRYDPLTRQLDDAAATYWLERESKDDPRQYFRQF